MEKEINLIKEEFEYYKDKYIQLKDKHEKLINSWDWCSGGFYYNLTPFEIERSGFKKGKLLKKEPSKKNNAIAYGKLDNKIYLINTYVQEYISQQTFFIFENQKIITVRYSDRLEPKTLDQITIVFLNKHDLPEFYLSYNEDRRSHTFVKETYMYGESLIEKIDVKGFISRATGKIIIDRFYKVIYDDFDNLLEILCQENNLASGIVRTLKVYPG